VIEQQLLRERLVKAQRQGKVVCASIRDAKNVKGCRNVRLQQGIVIKALITEVKKDIKLGLVKHVQSQMIDLHHRNLVAQPLKAFLRMQTVGIVQPALIIIRMGIPHVAGTDSYYTYPHTLPHLSKAVEMIFPNSWLKPIPAARAAVGIREFSLGSGSRPTGQFISMT
jgi:hypothetical protein